MPFKPSLTIQTLSFQMIAPLNASIAVVQLDRNRVFLSVLMFSLFNTNNHQNDFLWRHCSIRISVGKWTTSDD